MARILQIEDNNDIQKILQDFFSEEHEVIQAYSGTEGLRLFEAENIDLVLLDIMLPGKSGEQVLQEIRKVSSVPIIMLTALSDKQMISQYLLAGANDYIVKPFNLEEVYARVTVQLRSVTKSHNPATTKQTALSIKNITVNPDTFEISYLEKSVRSLLQYPKKIFTKEDLYESVWKEPYLPGDNTLNAQLSNLRRKLAQVDDSTDYIEIIWGLGVRLKGED
ncbi:response regulator transcription factor [Streptococcus mutans]|uniref:response regulator transcription factor n=1 Tax=Streptococcus mutans TaxID=1309 RepID=UPI0002B5A036|nr:response regulator transcription factor [Streptococcus mutans]EMC40085.1 putative response regulator [Streptococcus mutans 66-2A]MCB5117244.1 response regulator transcription factor [Streptococcus mutans]MDW5544737.1 response regulator transcription factor [Streptococcus mutans]MDW5548396.1 response regulator transcription factor [Streptococcus mutans]